MKKLLSFLAMVGVLGVAGCSCSKEGVYKFDSIVVTVMDEEITYSCAEGEDLDLTAEFMCEYMTKMEIELKDDKATMSMEGEEENETYDYKIEDGKFMMKDGDEFEEVGSYDDGKLVIKYGDGVKVVFTKD